MNIRITGTVLVKLCALSVFAGCAMLAQPGTLPTPEEECTRRHAIWSSSGGICQYPGGAEAPADRARDRYRHAAHEEYRAREGGYLARWVSRSLVARPHKGRHPAKAQR